MQVRLAFSVATILAQSDILLIDEVLAVGDASFQRKCFEYFNKLKKQKKTVVFVSHDMSAIRQYCDRVVLINNSEVVEMGEANKIAKLYSQLFLDEDSDQRIEDKGKRWGDKKVRYESISVDPVKPKLSEDIMIHATVKFNQSIEDAVLGFAIKNTAGEAILGSSSLVKQQPVIYGKTGDEYQATWRIPNIFNNGKYYIEPAIVHNGTVDISDWWEEAAYFEIRKEENTPYTTNPDIELEIIKR
jgi:ABC-2 type transport system ATP-binding protein